MAGKIIKGNFFESKIPFPAGPLAFSHAHGKKSLWRKESLSNTTSGKTNNGMLRNCISLILCLLKKQ